MEYFFEWIRQNLASTILTTVLICWGTFASYFALKNNTLLIELSPNGTHIIEKVSLPKLKAEAIEFVKLYLNLSYNFDIKSFKKNLGDVSSMMSQELWKEEGDRIISLIDLVEENNITQSGILLKITRPSPVNYEALIQVNQKIRANTNMYKVKVRLTIAHVGRTESNPWGIEVTEDIDEKM